MTSGLTPPWPLPEDVAAVVSRNRVFEEIASEMASVLDGDSSGHDFDHAWRVFVLGVRLADREGADERVVGAGALVHDIHRTMGDPGETVHPTESLPAVRATLEATSFPAELVPEVCHCVETHDEYAFRGVEYPPETLEAEIVQDADNLDALGAIGVARCFAFGARRGDPLWVPDSEQPVNAGLGHFEEKLYKLPAEMNTATARELAESRCEFLETFEERFRKEWYGEI